MRHKVGAHKLRQITIISYYSSVIQIKLYIFRQRNVRKNSAISTFEKLLFISYSNQMKYI